MSVRDVAREWLQRPMVILVCGRGDYASLLTDEFVHVVHVRSQTELDARLRHPSIDVAIIEDSPWPGEDASTVGRVVRARGIGTVFAARMADSGTRLLRERLTVDLNAMRLSEHLDNAVWLAICETELMRRDVPDWWKRISINVAPAFMRFIDDADGCLAPLQSTILSIFDDAEGLARAEGGSPLVASTMPPERRQWPDSESTVVLEPSESLLRSLRRNDERMRRRRRIITATVVAVIGIVAVIFALMHFLRR
jgi:hypothetical protein